MAVENLERQLKEAKGNAESEISRIKNNQKISASNSTGSRSKVTSTFS